MAGWKGPVYADPLVTTSQDIYQHHQDSWWSKPKDKPLESKTHFIKIIWWKPLPLAQSIAPILSPQRPWAMLAFQPDRLFGVASSQHGFVEFIREFRSSEVKDLTGFDINNYQLRNHFLAEWLPPQNFIEVTPTSGWTVKASRRRSKGELKTLWAPNFQYYDFLTKMIFLIKEITITERRMGIAILHDKWANRYHFSPKRTENSEIIKVPIAK